MYRQWAEKHEEFVKKADAVQKALSALQREADKIGKAEAIIVTLLPRTVAPLTDEMEIILE